MDCKGFNYCNKKASLVKKEPVCLKIAPVVAAELLKVLHRRVVHAWGLIFADGVQNFEFIEQLKMSNFRDSCPVLSWASLTCVHFYFLNICVQNIQKLLAK